MSVKTLWADPAGATNVKVQVNLLRWNPATMNWDNNKLLGNDFPPAGQFSGQYTISGGSGTPATGVFVLYGTLNYTAAGGGAGPTTHFTSGQHTF